LSNRFEPYEISTYSNKVIKSVEQLEHFPITLHRILRRSDSYGIRLA
jgi:hypothetical protein